MITEFINYERKVRGLSPRTCEEYEKELRAFARWARVYKLTWRAIRKGHIDAHTAWMHDNGLQPTSIRRRVSVVRNFYTWMRNSGLIVANPAQYAQSPKMPYRLPQSADIKEIDAYLNTPAYDGTDADIHCAVALMLETGMRISELMQLKSNDFDKATRSIRITGKGNKQRIVYYGDRSAKALNAYRKNVNGLLFRRYTDMSLRYAMYATAGRLVIGIHPHLLRHTYAMQLLNNGMDIQTLATLLGHSSCKTTEIYARATQARVAAAYNKFKM